MGFIHNQVIYCKDQCSLDLVYLLVLKALSEGKFDWVGKQAKSLLRKTRLHIWGLSEFVGIIINHTKAGLFSNLSEDTS